MLPTNPKLLRKWNEMTDREHLVWSNTFALQTAPPQEAAFTAEHAVDRLRELNIDQSGVIEPEYVAARSGFYLSAEQFIAWYRIAFKLIHGHKVSYDEPTDDECQQAYKRFEWGRCDFY